MSSAGSVHLVQEPNSQSPPKTQEPPVKSTLINLRVSKKLINKMWMMTKPRETIPLPGHGQQGKGLEIDISMSSLSSPCSGDSSTEQIRGVRIFLTGCLWRKEAPRGRCSLKGSVKAEEAHVCHTKERRCEPVL